MPTIHNKTISLKRALIITVDSDDQKALNGLDGWDMLNLQLKIPGDTWILHGITLLGKARITLRAIRYIWLS